MRETLWAQRTIKEFNQGTQKVARLNRNGERWPKGRGRRWPDDTPDQKKGFILNGFSRKTMHTAFTHK